MTEKKQVSNEDYSIKNNEASAEEKGVFVVDNQSHLGSLNLDDLMIKVENDKDIDWLGDSKSKIIDWYQRQLKMNGLSQRRLSRNLEILPQTLSESEIICINDDKARYFVNLYYKETDNKTEYKLDADKEELLYSGGDDYLCSYLVFRQGKVVWVDFGVNVENEFQGIHPALIVARPKNGILKVLPIVYREESERNPVVSIVSIENDSNGCGVALINEIKNISIYRVDRSKPSRNIPVSDFNKTLVRISEYYTDMFSNTKMTYYI